MIDIIALVVSLATATGTIAKTLHECLVPPTVVQQNVQQVVSGKDTHASIDDYINKQLDQRDSDTEIDIKINVHNIPHEERE